MAEMGTLADFKKTHPGLAGKIRNGLTAAEWARLTGEKLAKKETKANRVSRDLGSRAAVAKDIPANELPKIDDIFRDEPTRWIARRVLRGGPKHVMMDELLAAGIPLKTGKEPRQALVQDIPYVVRRLKQKGYDIVKEGSDYVWRKRSNRGA